MDLKYLQTLELPKILSRLAEYTSFSAGRELALNLSPSTELEEVRRRQEETSEARKLLETKADLPLDGARDIRPLAEKAGRGIVLLPDELLEVRDTLLAGRSLRRALIRTRGQFPLMAGVAERIEECPHLTSEIGRCINDRAEVVDEASQKLASIRGQLEEAHRRLMDKLEAIVSSPSNSAFLQEPLITQRSGRYCIPLKADFKGRIPGIVHDTSASGATLFIEPLATLELGNHLRELELEEEREVRRILAALSGLVAEEGKSIEHTMEALAELDLAFAKAKYAEEIEGVEPKLVPFKQRAGGSQQAANHPGSTIQLIKARHPLIPPEEVVPIDVHLGDDYFILVITGPNTGGKTVSLKTVGLLSLMAQCGLHIPAAEGSVLSPFDGIYADIGDEQSIEQSLSTFSSHMTNIIGILRRADERSLVLLDDLGAGTDPAEGSALARALLSHLRGRQVTTFVSTHYPELKVYAHVTSGVRNACVEFDVETLSPTYKLTIGLPGMSNALAISDRLGLPMEILDEARGLVSPQSLKTEALLSEIKRAHQEALEAREAAKASWSRAEGLEKELRERLANIEEEQWKVLRAAREEARKEIIEVRRELAGIRAGLASLAYRERLERAEESLSELERRAMPPKPPSRIPAGPLRIGDTVWVKSLEATGEITALFEEEAEVQIGRFKARVNTGELEPRLASEASGRREFVVLPTVPSPGPELNVRGQTVEEMLPRLEKYLNDAYLAGLGRVHILHGKGTGTLRRAVQERLNNHPLVAGWSPGGPHEGNEGVTVVELAK